MNYTDLVSIKLGIGVNGTFHEKNKEVAKALREIADKFECEKNYSTYHFIKISDTSECIITMKSVLGG